MACYTPDGTAQFSGGPPAVGREAIKAGIGFWFTAFPDLKLITEEALTEGNRLIQVWTVTGTHRGPLGPVPPTGWALCRSRRHCIWTQVCPPSVVS